MDADVGNMSLNLEQAERLVKEAFSRGSEWVVLPEFFPTAIAYDPVMRDAAMGEDSPAFQLLQRAAMQNRGFVGGSFICKRGEDRFNTWFQISPDGSYSTHDKDQPTVWENCYYTGGNDDGILQCGDYRVGVAMCWEFIRWRTARRLMGKIDMLVGGSCWPTSPRTRFLKSFSMREHVRNHAIMRESLRRMACTLGVPVIHAGHCGKVRSNIPLLPGIPYYSYFLGETQIIDGEGTILASHKDGAGVIDAEITPGSSEPTEHLDRKNEFWIPEMPWTLKAFWSIFNRHGRRYYRTMKRKGIY